VRAAAQAAAELRRAQPQPFPPTPHSWYALRPQGGEELSVPVLCATCLTRADPEGEVSVRIADSLFNKALRFLNFNAGSPLL
jgi:hypothetical protein